MIQSISSDSYTYLNSISNVSDPTAKTSGTDSTKKASESKSVKTDTIEISDEARAAVEQAKVSAAAGNKATVQNSEQQSPSAGQKVKASANKTVSASASGSTVTAQAVAEQKAQASADKATIAPASDSTDSTESSGKSTSGNYVLSTYTEAQLDKLVSEGKITKSEETTELAKRAAEKQQNEVQQPDEAPAKSSSAYGIDMYKTQAESSAGGASATEIGSSLDIVA